MDGHREGNRDGHKDENRDGNGDENRGKKVCVFKNTSINKIKSHVLSLTCRILAGMIDIVVRNIIWFKMLQLLCTCMPIYLQALFPFFKVLLP